MKVLLTGAAGQLGQALRASTPAEISLIPTCRNGGDGRLALDLADADACHAVVQEHRPDWVLNAGAYTAVDKAESEPELANAVNAEAPAAFATALDAIGGRLLHISTDFVFNGAQGSPYQPEQSKNPLGVYGASKAAGEDAILRVFKDEARAHILRTSWLMGPVGNNFALTMLRLHRERETLGVVSDQLGCPSSTINLATACWQSIKLASQGNLPKVMHWSDEGAASWYDVAVAVGELGQDARHCRAGAPNPDQRLSNTGCTAELLTAGLQRNTQSTTAQRRALATRPQNRFAVERSTSKSNSLIRLTVQSQSLLPLLLEPVYVQHNAHRRRSPGTPQTHSRNRGSWFHRRCGR